MRFGRTLCCIIRRILRTDPWLGPVYLRKVDLANSHMRLLVCLEDTPSTAFLVPRKNPTDEKLVGFHLDLPVVYVDSAPFFCMYTETMSDMANRDMGDLHHAPPHP